MKNWLSRTISSIRFDIWTTGLEIKRLWIETFTDLSKAWKDYKLYEWNTIGKPIAIFFITLVNIMYTIVMFNGAIIVTLLMSVAFPALVIVVVPPMWLLGLIFEKIVKVLKKKPEKIADE